MATPPVICPNTSIACPICRKESEDAAARRVGRCPQVNPLPTSLEPVEFRPEDATKRAAVAQGLRSAKKKAAPQAVADDLIKQAEEKRASA